MYPDLSYLLHDLLGTQPDNWTSIFKTFGLMLVLAILTAAWLLYLELKRMADEGIFKPDKVKVVVGAPASVGELVSNGIFGFLVGFKGWHIARNFAEFQADPSGVLLSLEGSLPVGLLGAALFAAIRYWEKKKSALPKPKTVVQQLYPHDRIGDITVIAAVTGIIGAKIFDVLENLPAFFADPIGTFFSGSGLAIYGGLICGFLGVTWYLRKHRIPFWPFADAVAPALMIAYGVGRIGCQLAGDGDWGIVAPPQPEWWFLPDWMWSFDYPHNVNNHGIPLPDCDFRYCHHLREGVFPTPFYETVLSLLIGGLLWALRKRLRPQGMLFFLYLTLNGIERFWIEKIRVNVRYDLLGVEVTQAEIIATLLFFIGIGGMIYLRRKQT